MHAAQLPGIRAKHGATLDELLAGTRCNTSATHTAQQHVINAPQTVYPGVTLQVATPAASPASCHISTLFLQVPADFMQFPAAHPTAAVAQHTRPDCASAINGSCTMQRPGKKTGNRAQRITIPGMQAAAIASQPGGRTHTYAQLLCLQGYTSSGQQQQWETQAWHIGIKLSML
jgi:hypothetical protein